MLKICAGLEKRWLNQKSNEITIFFSAISSSELSAHDVACIIFNYYILHYVMINPGDVVMFSKLILNSR